MSAAVAAVRVLGDDIPAGDLDGLCRAVRKRAAWVLYRQHDDRDHIWPALGERVNRARIGQTLGGAVVANKADLDRLFGELERDLRDLLAAEAERFAFCVRANVTNVAARPPTMRVAPLAVALPRVQPVELLTRLAATGVIVQAVDGNLHVQPAELLSAADRAVLTANKGAFLEALARPAAVI